MKNTVRSHSHGELSNPLCKLLTDQPTPCSKAHHLHLKLIETAKQFHILLKNFECLHIHPRACTSLRKQCVHLIESSRRVHCLIRINQELNQVEVSSRHRLLLDRFILSDKTKQSLSLSRFLLNPVEQVLKIRIHHPIVHALTVDLCTAGLEKCHRMLSLPAHHIEFCKTECISRILPFGLSLNFEFLFQLPGKCLTTFSGDCLILQSHLQITRDRFLTPFLSRFCALVLSDCLDRNIELLADCSHMDHTEILSAVKSSRIDCKRDHTALILEILSLKALSRKL